MSAYESRPAQAAPEVSATTVQSLPSRADIEALDALLASECALWEAGYRAGHADGLMQADRELNDSVRRIMADLDSWGWGGL